MVTITVQGHGSFVIDSSKLHEALEWLGENSMPVEVSNHNTESDSDETLLNE